MPENAKSPGGACFLDVLDDDRRQVREIPLAGRMTVGRGAPDTVDIPIPSQCLSASRQHADIEFRGKTAILTDHSRFGTLVNGRLLQNASKELHDGDDLNFGKLEDGWLVRFRVKGNEGTTTTPDPLEMLTVTEVPREVRIGRQVVDERLGDKAFKLLKFLADSKGRWYPVDFLVDRLWGDDPDTVPLQARMALSRDKRRINDLLSPHLRGQDAVESQPFRGYRMKPRLDGE